MPRNTSSGDDIKTVLERLTETIAWCGPRADIAHPRDCLRTPDLRPHPLEGDRKAIVAYVARQRTSALRGSTIEKARGLAGGRLLIYEPDINLAHGLEEDETNGYVDVNNTPPWDTWVAYIDEGKTNYLLSWVPAPFIALVSAGIGVCPEACIQWLDQTDVDMRRSLSHLV